MGFSNEVPIGRECQKEVAWKIKNIWMSIMVFKMGTVLLEGIYKFMGCNFLFKEWIGEYGLFENISRSLSKVK